MNGSLVILVLVILAAIAFHVAGYFAGYQDGKFDGACEQEKRKSEPFNIAVERLKTELSITKAKVVGAQHALKNDDIENALKWLKINEES